MIAPEGGPVTSIGDPSPMAVNTIDWSPDGSKLVFEQHDEASGTDIHVINRDGPGRAELSRDPVAASLPNWSPRLPPPAG